MAQTFDPNAFTIPFMATKTPRRDPYEAILPTNPANSQKGKIIVITGGSSGIGAAAARVWAEAGAEGVVITARGAPALEKVASELKAKFPATKVLAVKGDIVSNEDIKHLFSAVQETFGRPADVLLNNAGFLDDDRLIGETPADVWWKNFEINIKGAYNVIHQFIQSQPNPKEPIGTIITVSSGRAGFTGAGGSSYNIAKLAEHRLSEHLQLENPTLRVFTSMPGIALTGMMNNFWRPYAKDHVDLTGMQALYLAQPRADYLKGSMVGVNWDVKELEEHKEEILEKKVLQTSWMPILPFGGGKGLGSKV
ncbi:NAD(P)-binding protein [Mollisia scopiformis]|uniref:NAD(P)-binding protein n=1 Tax=Mollisia scopiformis TaxID=149040 RepID=A0A194XTI6_MOLSC|nr:NAD(P)-binding protein [Mollisia scopiformis]KUJ23630.1 NAD(P)-binding protein [Mollisia scopiformis]